MSGSAALIANDVYCYLCENVGRLRDIVFATISTTCSVQFDSMTHKAAGARNYAPPSIPRLRMRELYLHAPIRNDCVVQGQVSRRICKTRRT
jgi:hypothetical protein